MSRKPKLKIYPSKIDHICHEGALSLCGAVIVSALKDKDETFLNQKSNIFFDYLEGVIDRDAATEKANIQKFYKNNDACLEAHRRRAIAAIERGKIVENLVVEGLKITRNVKELALKIHVSQQYIYQVIHKLEGAN